jgi:hypothetical protein
MGEGMKRIPAAALVLVVLAAILVAARLHTYDEPLQTDITGAAVIGHEILAGRTLYADMWDHKPPALHLTHAVAIGLVGYGSKAIFLLNVTAGIVTLLGVYAAGTALGSVSAGLWAAAFWTVISGDVWMQGNQPNTEAFINACLVWAFALLVRADARWGIPRYLAIGVLFALGSLYKQVVVAPAAFLALAHVIAPPAGRSRSRAAADVAVIGGVGAAAWAAVLAYFAVVGRFGPFYEAVFTYNRAYTQGSLSHPRLSLNLIHVFSPFLEGALPLAVLAFLGLVLGMVVSRNRPWILFLALVLATPVAIWLPGAFAPHYYQLWLPTMVIGSGWAIAMLGRIAGQRIPYVVGAVVLVLVIANEAPLYLMPADEWSLIKYGPIFVEERKLAREIDTLLLPGESFYEWGSEVGLYYLTQRRPPGAFSVWPVAVGPAAGNLTGHVFAFLTREQPELYVVANWTREWITWRHPVPEWLGTHFRPMPGGHERGPFSLYVRRGGKLEARVVRSMAVK